LRRGNDIIRESFDGGAESADGVAMMFSDPKSWRRIGFAAEGEA
jgi:hypothetical protein